MLGMSEHQWELFAVYNKLYSLYPCVSKFTLIHTIYLYEPDKWWIVCVVMERINYLKQPNNYNFNLGPIFVNIRMKALQTPKKKINYTRFKYEVTCFTCLLWTRNYYNLIEKSSNCYQQELILKTKQNCLVKQILIMFYITGNKSIVKIKEY